MKRPKNTYWHFAPDNRRTRYDDKPIIIGKPLRVEPPIELCERGLHMSKRAIDALTYAPGAYVTLNYAGSLVIPGSDKIVSDERLPIAGADATEVLYRFAMDCAARAMERTGWKDERSWSALAIRQAHLIGLANDDDLAQATQAAQEAAREAEAEAASWASWEAAAAALAAAAKAAAEAASWASWEAAAERKIQNAELERRLLKLL